MIATKPDNRTAHDLLAISLHEAGHAVVALLLRSKIVSLDIELTAEDWGLITYRKPPLREVPAIAIYVAGYVAEQRGIGTIYTDSDETAPDIIDVFRALKPKYDGPVPMDAPEFHDGILLALRLINSNWPAVKHIARRLRAKRRLSGADVKAIFKTHKGEKCTAS